MSADAKELLKLSELASEAGFPVSTIRHYINEGLLDAPSKKSKNMAYYSRDIIPKIYLIKKLQDEHFLPLKMIKKLIRSGENLTFEEYNILIEVRGRLEEQGDLLPQIGCIPLCQILENLELTSEEMLSLEELKIVSPDFKDGEKNYNELDYRIIKAFSDCRTSGFSKKLGFSTDDLGMYLKSLHDLVEIESKLFMERVINDMSPDEIIELIKKGLPAVNEVISALHYKFIMDSLDEITSIGKDRRQ